MSLEAFLLYTGVVSILLSIAVVFALVVRRFKRRVAASR